MKFARMLTISSLVVISSFGLVRPELVAQKPNPKTESSKPVDVTATFVVGAVDSPVDEKDSQQKLTLKTYYVGDIVFFLLKGEPQRGGITEQDFESIRHTIIRSIAPDTWGKDRVVEMFVPNLSLIVTQTPKVHDEIQDLLAKIRELNRCSVELNSFVVLISKENKLLPVELGKNGKPITGDVVVKIRAAEKNKTLECIEFPLTRLNDGQGVAYKHLSEALWSAKCISAQVVIDESRTSFQYALSAFEELPIGPVVSPVFGTVRGHGEEAPRIAPTNQRTEVGKVFGAKIPDSVPKLFSRGTIEDGKYLALDVSSLLNVEEDRRAVLIVHGRIKDQKAEDQKVKD